MFARLAIVQIKSGRLEEATRLFEESVVPAAKAQKGFKGINLLTDPATGKGIAVSFWESEADALANEQSGYLQEQFDKFKDLFAAPPVREGYQVSVQG
ncbi:MAG: antibiotic biosynthesis monooxygenase [Chloroflexota bacterium]